MQYSEDEDSREDGQVYAKDKGKKQKDEDGNEDGGGFAEGGAEWSENSVSGDKKDDKEDEDGEKGIGPSPLKIVILSLYLRKDLSGWRCLS